MNASRGYRTGTNRSDPTSRLARDGTAADPDTFHGRTGGRTE